MIICNHTEINKPWGNTELEQKMALLPPAIKEQILRKKNHSDIQLSVCGNLLILQSIKQFDLNLTLFDLVYNPYHRPCFNSNFDFNISHSGNRVVCCATTNGSVGIDIEQVVQMNFNYDDYFTANEQRNIKGDINPEKAFITYWTRKEALLKAVGTGVYTPLLNIDVSEESFTYDGKTYYLSPVNIAAGYPCCIAHTVKQNIIVEMVRV